MRKSLFLLCTAFFSVFATAQEFAPQSGLSLNAEEEKQIFFLPLLEMPVFSIYRTEIRTLDFRLTEVKFTKGTDKRSVDFIARMEEEKAYREKVASNSYHFRGLSKDQKQILTISKGLKLYNRDSNYDPFTGEIKNPAYQELRSGTYNTGHPIFENYYGPYRFSPYNYFLR